MPTAGIEPRGVYVVACGAVAKELKAVVEANGLADFTLDYLPAGLHNTPALIPGEVEQRLAAAAGRHEHLFVGYGDCGTGGRLDDVLERYGAQRLPGSHCYEFFAGSELFARLHDAEPTTFYLTDFLLRQFDRLVWRGLGLDRWPQLLGDYFGNYTRLLYLSQVPPTPGTMAAAQEAADRLGLRLEHRHLGTGDVAPTLLTIGRRPA
jgi:hypothetical protein